jgi:outer membrane protein
MLNTFRKRMIKPAAWMLSVLMLMPAFVPAQDHGEVPLSDEVPAADMTMRPDDHEADGVPLTLREATALALDNNLNVAVRRYEPAVADAGVLGERGAFDPTLSFFGRQAEFTSLSVDPFTQSQPSVVNRNRGGSATYSDPTAIGGLITARFSGNANRFGDPRFAVSPAYDSALFLAYDQSLLRGFGLKVNKAGIRIAQRNQSISQSQFRQAVIDTLQSVEKAYWDLKFALQDLAVKRFSLTLSEETLGQNQIRVEVGTMAPIDVTSAEAEVASRSQDVLLAENALQNARDLLLLVLNQPNSSPLWVLPVNPVDEPPFDPELTIDLEGAIREAYANRPDLEQTEYLLQNDEDIVLRARDAMRQDLTARASYQRSGLTGKNTFNLGDPNDPTDDIPARSLLNESWIDSAKQVYQDVFDSWEVSLNWAIPLGNKKAKADFLTARLRQEQRKQLLDSQELDAVIAVRNSARNVLNTVERVKASRVNVRLQRERLAAENKRYDNGMTTTFELFQFQDDLTRAESQVNLAMVDYNKAIADLEASKGTIAQSRGVYWEDILEEGSTEVDLP